MTAPEPGEFMALLAPDEVSALSTLGRRRRWPRGDTVVHEGEQSDWILIISSGRVKVSSHTEGGVEVVLAIRGPGALIGELSAVDSEPRSATVTALEPVEGLTIPYAEFSVFLKEHGGAALVLMRLITGRLRDADRKRIEFGAYDTTGRVATRLLELAARFGEKVPEGVRVALPLSQDELAGWTGSSREAVSKALRTLRDRGWIETGRRRVVIHDLEALRRRAR